MAHRSIMQRSYSTDTPPKTVNGPSRSMSMSKTSHPSLSCVKSAECSAQSIVKALDNFLVAVKHMRETVMVPSRLKDLQVPLAESQAAIVPVSQVKVEHASVLTQVDLFTFYRMLDAIREELVSGEAERDDVTLIACDESVASSESLDSDQSDFDETSSTASSSNASGSRQSSSMEESRRLAVAFRRHLQGLFSVLHQLTDTANYLATRYEDEVKTTFE